MPEPTSQFDERVLAAERLGWFGGSFDPPHRGHLHVARTAMVSAGLDHVVWVPAAVSPHKTSGRGPAPGAVRAELLELLLADGDPELEARSSIWAGELEREGPSFTVDSLREVVAARVASGRAGGLLLLMGADQLAGLDRWREVDAVLELAEPRIVPRPGFGRAELEALRPRLTPATFARVEAGLLAGDEVDLSSTELRSARASGVDADLTPRVEARIEELGLYRDAGGRGSGEAGGAPAP